MTTYEGSKFPDRSTLLSLLESESDGIIDHKQIAQNALRPPNSPNLPSFLNALASVWSMEIEQALLENSDWNGFLSEILAIQKTVFDIDFESESSDGFEKLAKAEADLNWLLLNSCDEIALPISHSSRRRKHDSTLSERCNALAGFLAWFEYLNEGEEEH